MRRSTIPTTMFFFIIALTIISIVFFLFTNYKDILILSQRKNDFSVTNVNEQSCQNAKITINKAIESFNYCNTQTDCVLVSGPCPAFGCSTLINIRNAEKLRNLFEIYNRNECNIGNCKCGQIRQAQIKCINKKCTSN